MTIKQQTYEIMAQTVVTNLKKRGMEGIYFENSSALRTYLTEQLPTGSVITYGGSESLKESGVIDLLTSGTYQIVNRSDYKMPEQAQEYFSKAVLADYFFMSSNAITLDGELVNIDGNGNRVACLIHGPAHVILVVGMNKLCTDVAAAYDRVRNIATPMNTVRLNCNTPCHVTGRCGDCLSPDCICNQIVITRRSGHQGRIKVFLVGEELGY